MHRQEFLNALALSNHKSIRDYYFSRSAPKQIQVLARNLRIIFLTTYPVTHELSHANVRHLQIQDCGHAHTSDFPIC